MVWISKTPDFHEKLSVLSRDARYDIACACGTGDDDRRHRSGEDSWIYPVSFPDRKKTFSFNSYFTMLTVRRRRKEHEGENKLKVH